MGFGKGAAPEDEDLSEDGTISKISHGKERGLLSVAIMKSRAMTLMVFGSTRSLSVLE
jgi:hypothetical protein